MQHLEASDTPVLYIGRTVLKSLTDKQEHVDREVKCPSRAVTHGVLNMYPESHCFCTYKRAHSGKVHFL